MPVNDEEPRYQLVDSGGSVVGSLYVNNSGEIAIQEGTNQNEATFDSDGKFSVPALEADDISTAPDGVVDELSNRDPDTEYQNTEGKDIDVSVITESDGNADSQVQHLVYLGPSNGLNSDDLVERPNVQASTAVTIRVSTTITVPDGWFYKVDPRDGVIDSWREVK